MNNLTFEEYCNEPVFPEFVSVTMAYRPQSLMGYNPSIKTERSENKGFTRLDHFAESAMRILLEDALRKGLKSDGGFTTIDLAANARDTALTVLRKLHAIEFSE